MARVLIIAPNWIGDAVMTQPLLHLLKSRGDDIDVLATHWVAPVYQACVEVDEVISENFQHGRLQMPLRWKIARDLIQRHYSACYILPNSWKSLMIPMLAAIPQRIGYAGESRQWFLSQSLPNPNKLARPSMVKHYLALADHSANSQDAVNSPEATFFPKFHLPQSITELSSAVASKYLPNYPQFYIMAPGAEFGPAKQWPASHYTQLANLILEKNKDRGIFLLGSEKDAVIADQILYGIESKYASRIQNLCGKIPLNQAMGLVQLAQGLVSNDSGMMHVGAAFHIPQIAFFGSSDPTHTPPLSKKATIMYLGLDCSPCHARKCPLGHLNCLVQITPESASKAFHLLSKKG